MHKNALNKRMRTSIRSEQGNLKSVSHRQGRQDHSQMLFDGNRHSSLNVSAKDSTIFSKKFVVLVNIWSGMSL